MADHLLPVRLAGVTGPDCDPDVGDVEAVSGGHLPHLGQRRVQIAVDIVRQSLQRRDVDAIDALLQHAFPGVAGELVDDAGECRERLSRSGRGRDEDAATLMNDRYGLSLRYGKVVEPLVEPRGNERLHHPHYLVLSVGSIYTLNHQTTNT